MLHSDVLQEIPAGRIEGLRIGNAQDEEAKTGVTVLLFDQGARVGIDVSGGGPASRETLLADPLTADNPVHAIVLSGGSAYGLAAGDGVMRYLEERGVGFDTGFAKVPLVCQSCIYDLGLGRADVRPDARMGYDACLDAEHNSPFLRKQRRRNRRFGGQALWNGAGHEVRTGYLCGAGRGA